VCLLGCGRGRIQLAVALLDTSGTDMALYRDAYMVRAIVWARRVKFCRVLPVARPSTRSPRLGAPGLRPAGLLVAAFGGRPRRPRVAMGAFTSAAEADLGLLAGSVLLTRTSTRSAVSRSINSVAIFARSTSRRASRSLIFVLSALIWSNIVGVVVGMVTFTSFRSIG